MKVINSRAGHTGTFRFIEFVLVGAAIVLCWSTIPVPGSVVDPPARLRTESPVSCELSCSTSGGAVSAKLTFKNTSKKEISVLKRDLLLEPGRLTWSPFEVTFNGSEIEYRGILAKRAAPTAADYVSMKPGEVIHASVDISKDYDFSRKGIYKVSYFSLNVSLDGKSDFEIRSNPTDVTVK